MSRIVSSRESGHVAEHVMLKSRFSRFAAWLSVNVGLLPAPPIFTYVVLNRDIEAFYRAHPNASTNGDSLSIPVFGVALLTFGVLLFVNASSALLWLWRVQCGL